MNKLKGIRQGDLAFIQIDKLPENIKKSDTNIILSVGSGGNPHSFKGGEFYTVDKHDFIIGYLKANKTKLYHAEHSPKGDAIEDGLYEIRKQVEITHEGMKQVID